MHFINVKNMIFTVLFSYQWFGCRCDLQKISQVDITVNTSRFYQENVKFPSAFSPETRKSS